MKAGPRRLCEEEVLAPYRHYLTSMRRFRPHQLAEGEEKILIETRPGGTLRLEYPV
jgi:oligoendopeptidase F